MKRETLSGVRHFKGRQQRDIQVEYYFLKDYRFGEDESPLCGIKIVKSEIIDDQDHREVETAPSISYSEKFVKQIIQVMMQGLVTPIHMLEVIDQMVTLNQQEVKKKEVQAR